MRPWLADGLVPLLGSLRELVFEREEEGGVQRGEAVCLRFRVAFGEVFGERVVGLRFLYNSYIKHLASACLRLATVHFSIGGNPGLVEKANRCLGVLEDAWLGESRAIREQEPGARLRDCARTQWTWSRLAVGMLPER